MKKILLLLISTVILSGCGKNKPIPASRLEQPNADFSFLTPEGWFRNSVLGIDFIIVSTKADYGIEPNIFVDFISQSPDLNVAISKLTTLYKKNRDFKIIKQSRFETKTGLHGIKIYSHRKTKKQIPLTSYHYLIVGTNRVVSITGTCADAVGKKYEPIFDQTMSTLEMEK